MRVVEGEISVWTPDRRYVGALDAVLATRAVCGLTPCAAYAVIACSAEERAANANDIYRESQQAMAREFEARGLPLPNALADP